MFIYVSIILVKARVYPMIDVADTIEEVLQLKSKKEEHKPRVPGVFHPSEAMQCMRRTYYNVISPELGKKEDFPLGLFHMAKSVEQSIIDLVRQKHGALVIEQKRIEAEIAPGVMLHGFLDFALTDKKGKIKHVFEIKSTRDISYTIKENAAKVHHRAQLQCYLHTFKCMTGSVVYVERGDLLKMKQFDETYDEDLWADIISSFSKLAIAMEKGVPPPPVPVEKWECRYCAYQVPCTEARREEGYERTTGGIKKCNGPSNKQKSSRASK